MKTLFRWILLVLAIGGGFTGLVITVQAMFQSEANSLPSFVICGVFVILYIFTIVSGLLFADNPRCTIPLMVSMVLQTPWLSSPILVYSFGAGLRITVGYVDGSFSAGYRFGSDFQFFILGDHPWGIGINLFAVAVLILLMIYRRTLNV